MRRLLLAAAMLGMASGAHALQKVGIDCEISWGYYQDQEYRVEGFAIFDEGYLLTEVFDPAARSVTCAEAGLAKGIHNISVIAFNADGDGMVSPTLRFQIHPKR